MNCDCLVLPTKNVFTLELNFILFCDLKFKGTVQKDSNCGAPLPLQGCHSRGAPGYTSQIPLDSSTPTLLYCGAPAVEERWGTIIDEFESCTMALVYYGTAACCCSCHSSQNSAAIRVLLFGPKFKAIFKRTSFDVCESFKPQKVDFWTKKKKKKKKWGCGEYSV